MALGSVRLGRRYTLWALIEHPEHLAHVSAGALVPLLVLLASLAGSLHCVGMCGGIMAVLPPRPLTQIQYHLGRLMGYLTLGALAGHAGHWLLGHQRQLMLLSAGLLGLTFAWLGWRLWRGDTAHVALPKWLQAPLHKLMGYSLTQARQEVRAAGLMVGLLSVFLPCGWLYTFILGAVATQDMWAGAAFLFAFWLGTVPALTVGATLLNQILPRLGVRGRRISATLLMLAGTLLIYVKLASPAALATGAMCH
jgi:sulfite exporter TauE/SafE